MKKQKLQEIRSMINGMQPAYTVDLSTGKYYFGSSQITEQQFQEAPESKHVKIHLGEGVKPDPGQDAGKISLQ